MCDSNNGCVQAPLFSSSVTTNSLESGSCTEPGIELPTMPPCSRDDSKDQPVTSYSSDVESEDDVNQPDED